MGNKKCENEAFDGIYLELPTVVIEYVPVATGFQSEVENRRKIIPSLPF